MVSGEVGFRVDDVRRHDKVGLKGKVFYFDEVHPDGVTGSR